MVQFSRNGFFIHFSITIAICNEVSQKCLSVVTLEKKPSCSIKNYTQFYSIRDVVMELLSRLVVKWYHRCLQNIYPLFDSESACPVHECGIWRTDLLVFCFCFINPLVIVGNQLPIYISPCSSVG